MISVKVLGNRSEGSCTLLTGGRTRLLVDAGLSCVETMRRMRFFGEDSRTLDGILISHEHREQVSGVPMLSRSLKLPVFASEATYHAWMRYCETRLYRVEIFSPGRAFQVGDVSVLPFTIPHDAADPVGFTFCINNSVKVCVVTGLDYLPPSVEDHMRGCDIVVTEFDDPPLYRLGRSYSSLSKRRRRN